MYYSHHKYKRLTLIILILGIGSFVFGNPTNFIAIYVKSLSSSTPVSGAVIDLNTCNLGKFYSNEEGKVLIPSQDIASCVMYISASGYMSLVKSFSKDHLNANNELTFFMQRQDKYKIGQISSTDDERPVSGVEIRYQITNTNTNYSTMSDKEGKFSILMRKNKAVTLYFYHPDFKYLEKTIKPQDVVKGLGNFKIQPHQPDAMDEVVEDKISIGYSARKFSYQYTRRQHIIVVDKVRSEADFKLKRKNWEIQSQKVDNLFWFFTGPYYSKQLANNDLSAIRRVYPNARIEQLP